MITDKNALSIERTIGWKKLLGQVELPKLSCELSGSKGRGTVEITSLSAGLDSGTIS